MRHPRGQATVVVVTVLLLISTAVPVSVFLTGGTIDPTTGDDVPTIDTSAPSDAPEGREARARERIRKRINVVDQYDALRSVGAFEAHTNGITGEGVTVGIVGKSFDTDAKTIASHVADDRRFGGRRRSHRDTSHGTAVGEIVTSTAPKSELYLAAIGSEPTPERYHEAVRWLVEHDVDVIVDSGSYFPKTMSASANLSQTAQYAIDHGVIYVTSAGNYAGHHWSGTGTESGWINFSDDGQANALGTGPISGKVSIRAQWDSPADYDLYLYRDLPGSDDPVVAKSVRRSYGGMEAIDVVVPEGHYYVAIYARSGIADPGTVQLFSARHRLSNTDPRGSVVAPTTGKGIITVGALGPNGSVRSYSSLGADGTVDLSAPDGVATDSNGAFYGTSAATPFVGGAAALVASQGNLTPAQTEYILEQTSREEGLNAYAAASAASRPFDVPESTVTGSPGSEDAARSTVAHSREAGWTDGIGTNVTIPKDDTERTFKY
ncbi:S8 family serine peptidase [Halogeometricum borinquense]|uniref:S8 family serine peptidase n=1 Tax=Halogeometricum borinquense TaxID=60847 RepID=UPI001EF7A4C9|nr:S8 family serine peptidase [Halogeometricum borinquense]